MRELGALKLLLAWHCFDYNLFARYLIEDFAKKYLHTWEHIGREIDSRENKHRHLHGGG
jgi:hypothetical protein